MALGEGLFGAPTISYDDLIHIERSSPNLIVYALPLVAFFTLLEFALSWYGNHRNYSGRETLGSLMIGIGNLFINLGLKIILFSGAIWIYNLLPWRMQLEWWTLIPCFIAYDFCSYWSHRISHFNRFFWATHVVHHSSEHFNLTVSFRQSWVQHFKLVFFIPVALMGFHPIIIFIASQLSVLYQFWIHTEHIKKLHPLIEYIFVTPSHHRVHHGSNEKYLDKNFGSTFIVWDRWFNSFQPEEEKPVYGLTKPIEHKVNPLYLNFHEYIDIWQDIRSEKDWRKRWFYLTASPAEIARKRDQLSETEKR